MIDLMERPSLKPVSSRFDSWDTIGTDSDYNFNAIKPNKTISTTNLTAVFTMLLLLSNSYLFNPNEKKQTPRLTDLAKGDLVLNLPGCLNCIFE